MTTVFLNAGVSSFPNPGNWNPTNNKIECLGFGGWGKINVVSPPLAATESDEVTPLVNQAAGGGGGGAYAYATNLNPSFPVALQIRASLQSPNGSMDYTAWGSTIQASYGNSGIQGGAGGQGGVSFVPQGFAGATGGSYSGSTGGGGGGAGGPHGAGSQGGVGTIGYQGGAGDGGTVPGQTTAATAGNSGTQWDASHGTGGGGAGANASGAPNGGVGGAYGGGGGSNFYPTGTVAAKGGDALIVVTYAPIAPSTWSATDKSASVTLSNNNLTATATATNQGVRGNAPKRAGKYYFEITCNTIAAGNTGVGIATFGHSFALGGANPVYACIVYRSGNLYVDGTIVASIGGLTNGALVCFAIDIDNNLIWARLGAAGNWNNGAANNPATGVGGQSMAPAVMGPGIDLYITALLSSNNEQATINTGGSAFAGAVPAGFTPGWDDSVSPLANMVATQVGTEVWQTSVPNLQVTQVGVEVWQTPPVVAMQLTQIGAEVWVPADSYTAIQATQVILEMWSPGGTTTPLALMTSIVLEMWAPSAITVPPATAVQARAQIII